MAGNQGKRKMLRTEDDLTEYDRMVIDEVCHKCNFYHDGQEYYEEDYECVAYELVRYMLEQGQITKDEIVDFFTRIDLNPERQLRSVKQ